LDNFDQ
jgi:hypothetical protein